jgi:hypothetical protein
MAASAVVMVHFAFVAFVLLGGLFVLRWKRIAWLHLPALGWGVFTEFAGIVCPLTPLEVSLWRRAGEAGYEGDFLTHYLMPILYPAHLTRDLQIWLGLAALLPNAVIYGYLLTRTARHR